MPTTLGGSQPALTLKVTWFVTQEALPWFLAGHFVGGRHKLLFLREPFRWSKWSRGGLEVLLPLLELGKPLLRISSCKTELLVALHSGHCCTPHELVFQPILLLTMPESVTSLCQHAFPPVGDIECVFQAVYEIIHLLIVCLGGMSKDLRCESSTAWV